MKYHSAHVRVCEEERNHLGAAVHHTVGESQALMEHLGVDVDDGREAGDHEAQHTHAHLHIQSFGAKLITRTSLLMKQSVSNRDTILRGVGTQYDIVLCILKLLWS